LRLVADPANTIHEGNESDNEYTRTINVTPGACALLTVNVSPVGAGTISKTAENCSAPLAADATTTDAEPPASDRPAETHLPDGLTRSAAMNDRFKGLINRAALGGAVRVIVGLRTSFQPEGRLSLLAAR